MSVDRPSFVNLTPNKDISQRLPLVDIPMNAEQLIKSAVWEYYSYGENGSTISGVVGHWGRNVNNEELAFFYNNRCLQDKDGRVFTPESEEIVKPGFERRFSYPIRTSKQDAFEAEIEIGIQAIKTACEVRGVKPNQIRLMFVSGEFLGLPDKPEHNALIPRMLADRSGISKSAHVHNNVLACNSGSEARRMVGESQTELDGQHVLYVELEGLTKVTPPSFSDAGVPVFTNEVQAGVQQVGVDYSIIPGKFEVIPDPEGSITGPFYWPKTEVNKHGLMILTDAKRQPLPNPDNSYDGSMNPFKTIRWVLRYVKPSLVKSFNELRNAGYFQNGVLTISHPASFPVQSRLYTQASKELGIDLNSVWYKTDGNSSCAASPVVLLRASRDGVLREAEEQGRDIFYFGFGVGGNCSGMVIKNTYK
ncbi:hypothetical protein HYT02_01925 [Candidatus Gottesmanbacteria bacterium]|nr:hypothetical protein [Candidatus Gottesmanbacteria bacterium]